MSSSDFLRRARKRPAPENFDTHQEEIKRIAPSIRTNKPTYLHRSKPSTTFQVLTPVPSTSWSWDTESQSEFPRRDTSAYYMEFSRSMQAHDGDRYQIQGKSPSYDYTNWSPSDYGKNHGVGTQNVDRDFREEIQVHVTWNLQGQSRHTKSNTRKYKEKVLGLNSQTGNRHILEDTSHTKRVHSRPHTDISHRSAQVTKLPQKEHILLIHPTSSSLA